MYATVKESYYSPYSLDKVAEGIKQEIEQKGKSPVDCVGQQGYDFLDYYERLTQRFPSNFSMLHINIRKGYCVLTWLKRFPNCTITGVQESVEEWRKTQSFLELSPEEKYRLNVIEVNPEDTQKLEDALEGEVFDIILDHGHRPQTKRIQIFETLFPQFLAKGGIYIWEDVFCNSQPLLGYAQDLIPFTYKFSSWQNCKTLQGRKNIVQQMKKNWKYSIEDISFHRDLIVFSKEKL